MADKSVGARPPADAMPGGHDWHAPDYVRRWVAEKDAQIEERERQFALLAERIPRPSEAPIRVLDVGAGWGPLSLHILRRFSAADVTLLDYSQAMLSEARRRLAPHGGRTRFQVGDLTRPGALANAMQTAGAPFDAVVASCCFHNVDPVERVRQLYREAREVLAPGGCFLNLDSVGTDDPILLRVARHVAVERLRQRRRAETGSLPPYADVATELEARHRDRFEGSHVAPECRAASDHLAWLREAGFDAVECFWREGDMALIGGYVAAGPNPPS